MTKDDTKGPDDENLAIERILRRRGHGGRADGEMPEIQDEGLRPEGEEEDVRKGEELPITFDMKPMDVKKKLDEDVIGQDTAKKYLSNAVCYHYARVRRAHQNGNGGADTAIKKNVLLIGNTGVGKTYLVSKLAHLVGVPFVKTDATKYSATGYVGRDVEDMVRDLFLAAERNIRLAEFGMVYVDEIDKIRGMPMYGKDVSGAEVQRGLLKLMEETEVDLFSNIDPMMAARMMVDPKGAKKKRSPKINTKHILFIMSGAFPGLQETIEQRVMKQQGVMVDDTNWCQFLTADDLVGYGLEAEFVGRLPVRVGLHDLTEKDLFTIMTTSGDSIIKQYVSDFSSYGIKTVFTDDAMRAFAHTAAEERTGARALAGVIERTLLDFLYELPSSDVKEFVVDKTVVESPRKALVGLVNDSEIDRFVGNMEEGYGVRLAILPTSRRAIAEVAIKENRSPISVCEGVLTKYVEALKYHKRKQLLVTPEVVLETDEKLRKMLEAYRKGATKE